MPSSIFQTICITASPMEEPVAAAGVSYQIILCHVKANQRYSEVKMS